MLHEINEHKALSSRLPFDFYKNINSDPNSSSQNVHVHTVEGHFGYSISLSRLVFV